MKRSLVVAQTLFVAACMTFAVACDRNHNSGSSGESVLLQHTSDEITLTPDPQNPDLFTLEIKAKRGGLTYQLEGKETESLHSLDLIGFWNDTQNPNSLINNPPVAELDGTSSEGTVIHEEYQLFEPQWDESTQTQTYKAVAVSTTDSQFAEHKSDGLNKDSTSRKIAGTVTVHTTTAAVPLKPSVNILTETSSLKIGTTTSSGFVVSDRGSGLRYSVEIFRPRVPAGYFFVSDAAFQVREYSSSTESSPLLVLQAQAGDPTALAAPVDATLVWANRGFSGQVDWSVYQPVAPDGYTCLGVFIQDNFDDPVIPDALRCVRNDLVTAASNLTFVWNAPGGASRDSLILGTPGVAPNESPENLVTPYLGLTVAATPSNSAATEFPSGFQGYLPKMD